MAFLGGFFSHKDPSKEAAKYTSQIPEQLRKYLGPSAERGEAAGDYLQDSMAKYSDPQEYYNQMMQAYKPSEGYQFKQGEMGSAMANTAAAGGMRGSGAEQLGQSKLTQSLLSNDMQQYMDNILGIGDRGDKQADYLYGEGLGSERTMADTMSNLLNQQGSQAYKAAQEHNAAPWDIFKGVGKAVGSMGWL